VKYFPEVEVIGPSPYCPPKTQYPVERLEDMYPEIYHRVYPKIMRVCAEKDDPDMYPYPSRAMVESMTDEVYMRTVMEIGDPEDDGYGMMQGRQVAPFGFGRRRRLLRDLIRILLIRELLRRRRR
jgi:hypothetical protein